jgi:PiT family inorganic phosphate transporter
MSEIVFPALLAPPVAGLAAFLATTRVSSGSVTGTGIGRKGASVRWRTAGRIAIGCRITIPAAGLVGALAAWVAPMGIVGMILDAVPALTAELLRD